MTTITPQILLKAYAAGIFPMAESADDPSLYWVEPEERGVIPLDHLHVPHSLRKTVRKMPFDVRVDTAFAQVIAACAVRTSSRKATWINDRIRSLYTQLAQMGFAHSVESWQNGRLVGGLYGVRIGAAFFGESMFSRADDSSKVALVHLVARLNYGRFKLLDAQFMNDHLERFGAQPVLKRDYKTMLEIAISQDADFYAFTQDAKSEVVLNWAMHPEETTKI